MIGIGVDLVEVERIRTALARTPSLRDRLFTADEQAYAESAKDPAERYAALKDAVTETEPTFRDDLLGEQPVIEILTTPVYVLADRWRSTHEG